MICCNISRTVDDTATGLKQAALDETRRRHIGANIYYLTRYANPYALDSVVIIAEGTTSKVFDCGDLVYHMVGADLKKYICGDWVEALGTEAAQIKAQRLRVRRDDEIQTLRNDAAKHQYIVC